MVNTPDANEPVTPEGNAPAVIEAPVPPPVTEYVIGVIAVLIHLVCASVPEADVLVITEFACTVIVPDAVGLIHGPVVLTV